MKKGWLIVSLFVCGCGVPIEDETAMVEEGLTVLQVVPAGTYNGYGPLSCEPGVTSCVTGGRNFDCSSAFESQLADWGCDAPRAWVSGKNAGWWFFSLCPKRDALGEVLGGVKYGPREIIPGPLTDWVLQRSKLAPIWSAFISPAESGLPTPPADKSIVSWDPNCPSGCAISAFK